MKHLILFLCLATANVAKAQIDTSVTRGRDDYEPLVKEGKTFWYTQRDVYNEPNTKEFGFRIGEKIELDGESYNVVKLIRKGYDNLQNNSFTVSDEDIVVQYMSEEDKRVRTRDLSDHGNYDWNASHSYISLNYLFGWAEERQDQTYDLYDFNTDIDSYKFGKESCYYVLKRLDTRVRNIQGTDRVVSTYVKDSYVGREDFGEPLGRLREGCIIELIEGVGPKLVEGQSRWESNLIFAPYGCDQYTHWPIVSSYELRYVTDEKNNVLYEGLGGLKLWEKESDLVEAVNMDSEGREEWFSLEGLRIARPSTPGIYIRKCGKTVSKVKI